MELVSLVNMTSKLIVLACLLVVSQARFINFERPYISSRIIGGEDAEPGEFPHQVSLQWGLPPLVGFQHFCGGSIINEQWVLTAVHCLLAVEKLPKVGIFIVKAGKQNLEMIEPSEQVSLVRSYFMHEKYSGKLEAGPYDIGLIKLSSLFKFNKRVAPISLPKKDAEPTGAVILSGWGAVNEDFEHPQMPRILQRADLEIVDRLTCNQAVAKVAEEEGEHIEEDLVDETNICTGPLTGGLTACSGDSGGPLISKDESGNTEVVGVVSWGMSPCGRKGAPAVYVKVSSFIDWIENIISKN